MTPDPSPIKPPTSASPGRRVLHSVLALGGWMLFVYWWWIVFQRTSQSEIRFTLLFVAVSLLVIVVTTALWAWHNLRIHERRGPRTHLRQVTADFSSDGVGRPVTTSGAPDEQLTAPVVHVWLTGEGKRYEPAAGLPPAGAR